MNPAAALTPESFDLISIFLRADWVVKLVMTGLALASLWSWTIILDKLVRFSSLNRQANAFEDAVASGRSLEDVAADAGEHPAHALPRMLQAALKEWRDGRAKSGASEGQLAFLVQRIDRTLDTIIARESARVETGLGGLAIVATASPFVGLFGTVWGIMHAFTGLANLQQVTLATVAPGIAEALVATAIGLFAAIPAVVAYNRFARDIDRIAIQMETFIEEFSNILQRNVGQTAAVAGAH